MNRVTCIFVIGTLLTSVCPAVSAQIEGFNNMGALQSAAENYADRAAENAATGRQISSTYQSGINSGLGHLNQGLGSLGTLRDFGEGFGPLVPDDMDFDPDFNPPGQPSIPVHCEVSGGAQCQQCYLDAHTKLNFVRHYLEVLRGIYGATRKYTNNAIAFGDSMAGLHGGFGLAWPVERKGIQDAMKDMNKTYDEKYEAYMRSLLNALQAVASCEKQYFGEDDWYSRFGFIYYSYMQDRYHR